MISALRVEGVACIALKMVGKWLASRGLNVRGVCGGSGKVILKRLKIWRC